MLACVLPIQQRSLSHVNGDCYIREMICFLLQTQINLVSLTVFTGMHQSGQIISKDCSYLFLQKCVCDGNTRSFEAFSFPIRGAHSHAPAPPFQPSCQNASDGAGPKSWWGWGRGPAVGAKSIFRQLQATKIALAFTLGSKLCIHFLPKLLFVQFQAFALERFLPEGNDKRRVLEERLSPSESEDCESEGNCVTG